MTSLADGINARDGFGVRAKYKAAGAWGELLADIVLWRQSLMSIGARVLGGV